MRNRSIFNNLFGHNRKVLYMVLSIVMVSVLTLTVVYAALSTTLNINGNAEISAASWDIYLDNVKLNSQSSTANVPTITDKTTASFSTTLNKPGDFYEFTIDVVNNGSIDAMINSVTKTPELSDSQKKYLNYVVEYQNGEAITTKQLVGKKSFVRLKVRVEFRKDLTTSDLPKQSETLDLSFKVNYIQADTTGTNVEDNGVALLNIVSGDLNTVGSEIAIGDEHFYIISNDEESVTMLAKYNLYVGYDCTDYRGNSCTAYGEAATGIQDSTMLGYMPNGSTIPKGVTDFSATNYWTSTVSSYPAYIYNSNSYLYNYVENYRSYLEGLGVEIEEARLMRLEEFEPLGCSIDSRTCKSSEHTWIYDTSFWTGSVFNSEVVWIITAYKGDLDGNNYVFNGSYGVRPVIKMLKSEF